MALAVATGRLYPSANQRLTRLPVARNIPHSNGRLFRAALWGPCLAVGFLAACTTTLSDVSAAGVSLANGPGAPAKMATAGNKVIIAGPSGFCVDPSNSHDGADGAFVLMGSCASISRSPIATRPKTPAVLTATVFEGTGDGAVFADSFPQMAKFLSSEPGRAALSRSGKSSSVKIGQIASLGDVMFMRVSDGSGAQTQEIDAEYWRAIFEENGQIVTLTVLGLQRFPIDGAAKRALLDQFVAKVRASN